MLLKIISSVEIRSRTGPPYSLTSLKRQLQSSGPSDETAKTESNQS